MAYNRNHARSLLSASELALFESSLADNIRDHKPAALQQKIRRARTLRDKYRDLYRRQSLATRDRTGAKRGPAASSNVRTERKARLFDEVLSRLTARAATLDAGGSGGTGATPPARAASGARDRTRGGKSR